MIVSFKDFFYLRGHARCLRDMTMDEQSAMHLPYKADSPGSPHAVVCLVHQLSAAEALQRVLSEMMRDRLAKRVEGDVSAIAPVNYTLKIIIMERDPPPYPVSSSCMSFS